MRWTDRRKISREKKSSVNKKNINLAYAIIWISLLTVLLICYIILNFLDGFRVVDFVKDILGNLMGVLATFIIFDVVHNKLSKDSYADEVSEQILDTLLEQNGVEALDDKIKTKFVGASLRNLGNNSVASAEIADILEKYLTDSSERSIVLDRIEKISDKQKELFIKSNVQEIIKDSDAVGMVNNFLDLYLKKENIHRLRTNFSYEFILATDFPKEYDVLSGKNDYILVHEVISYNIKFLCGEKNYFKTKDGIVRLGFPYDNITLDKFLRESVLNQQNDKKLGNCLFSESLCITKQDKEYFSKLNSNELQQKVIELFKPHLTIDGKYTEIFEVKFYNYGIIIEFKIMENMQGEAHKVDIVFYMPKLKQGILESILVDPTKDPKITIYYPENMIDVEMYSFLNKSDDTSYDNTYIEDNGMYRIILNNTWVFPVSGVVFTIKSK